MYRFEIPEFRNHFSTPERSVSCNGILVELFDFDTPDVNFEKVYSHHILISHIRPNPLTLQGFFGHYGDHQPPKNMGSLVFIPAGVPTVTCYRPQHESMRVMVVRFAPTLLDHLLKEEDLPQPYDPKVLANFNLQDQEILHCTRQLAKELLTPGMANKALVQSIGIEILVRIARHYHDPDQKDICRGGLSPWQLRQIMERISGTVNGDQAYPPTLEDLAELVGISVGHLRRAFKQSTNITIGEYIRNTRFDRACNLLSNSSLSIKEIASQLGFNAQHSFTVAFRRSAGETPTSYRQRIRSSNRQESHTA